jgi:hypothetical protein
VFGQNGLSFTVIDREPKIPFFNVRQISMTSVIAPRSASAWSIDVVADIYSLPPDALT